MRRTSASGVARGDTKTIGSMHAITLVSESGRHMRVVRPSLGTPMVHGSFGLFTDRLVGKEVEAGYS